MSEPSRAELVIVGGGPTGLYAAYYAGFRGLETTVLESLPILGGQIATFYPESAIYDVPGFPSVTGAELVARLEEQARRFPIAFRLGERVTDIRAGESEVVVTSVGRSLGGGAPGAYETRAQAVLIAAGIGSFAPQRLTDPAIARFEGRGLEYHVDAAGLRGRRTLVIGGSQRAVELARLSAEIAAETFLVHRRDRLQADPDARDRLAAAGVRFLPFRELAEIGGAERVESATLVDRRDGSREAVAVDLIVPCSGFAASAESTRRFGLALEGDAVVVDSRMAASRPRVFAAGDGASYPGKVRLLAADFGEACTAVNNIATLVVPGSNLFPGYSSHRQGAAQRPRRRGT